MQELIDSIKRSNMRIMGIVEGEEVQAKWMCNKFNKIITENFSNLEKVMPIQVQEASRTPNKINQKRITPWDIIIKTQAQRIEKEYWRLSKRKNKQYTKVNPSKSQQVSQRKP
jgi:hypothetical protein